MKFGQMRYEIRLLFCVASNSAKFSVAAVWPQRAVYL